MGRRKALQGWFARLAPPLFHSGIKPTNAGNFPARLFLRGRFLHAAVKRSRRPFEALEIFAPLCTLRLQGCAHMRQPDGGSVKNRHATSPQRRLSGRARKLGGRRKVATIRENAVNEKLKSAPG